MSSTEKYIIVISSAIILICCSYSAVCWIKKTDRPWEDIVTACRNILPRVLLCLRWHGIGLIVVAGCSLLGRQLLYDQLPMNDRSFFLRMAWIWFLGGSAFVVATEAALRITRRRNDSEPPKATP